MLLTNKLHQGTLSEGEGSVQFTSFCTSLDELLFIMQTLFTFLQNKLPCEEMNIQLYWASPFSWYSLDRAFLRTQFWQAYRGIGVEYDNTWSLKVFDIISIDFLFHFV